MTSKIKLNKISYAPVSNFQFITNDNIDIWLKGITSLQCKMGPQEEARDISEGDYYTQKLSRLVMDFNLGHINDYEESKF